MPMDTMTVESTFGDFFVVCSSATGVSVCVVFPFDEGGDWFVSLLLLFS